VTKSEEKKQERYAKKAMETPLGEIAKPVGNIGDDGEDTDERHMLDNVHDDIVETLERCDLTPEQARWVLVTALANVVALSLEEKDKRDKETMKTKKTRKDWAGRAVNPLVFRASAGWRLLIVAKIEASVAPVEIARAFWKDPFGKVWRIPHDWRRRRIRLPDCDGLLRNNLPRDMAQEFGGRIVAVNYHPGSLCCLRDGYRVRDGRGGRWPVRAADCVVVGFGDEGERYI
jgi:hypothetical protein